MTLPRTAAEVLSGHVTLEVRCIDRVMLTFRQPRLQYGQGIHNFFCQHRGNRFVSSALMLPMTERFTADIRHYIDTRRLDLVRFAKGQSKDQLAKEYLAGHHGGECILFVGVAQEKTRVWRTAQRRDPATGKRYPWLYQEQAMVNHWYFYGFDADFGPFHIKFCGYFPYTGQIYFNGHEYAKQQCLKEGIALHGPGQRVRHGQRPGGGPADLRRADRPEDLPVRRQVAGPAAAAVHPRRRGRRLPLAAVGQAGRVLHDHGPGPAGHRADLLRAADPRQPRHRPPGQGEHRLRPDHPPARQVPHPRDLPHPGHHRPAPAPTSTCTTRRPRSSSTSRKDERSAPRPPSTSRATSASAKS